MRTLIALAILFLSPQVCIANDCESIKSVIDHLKNDPESLSSGENEFINSVLDDPSTIQFNTSVVLFGARSCSVTADKMDGKVTLSNADQIVYSCNWSMPTPDAAQNSANSIQAAISQCLSLDSEKLRESSRDPSSVRYKLSDEVETSRGKAKLGVRVSAKESKGRRSAGEGSLSFRIGIYYADEE